MAVTRIEINICSVSVLSHGGGHIHIGTKYAAGADKITRVVTIVRECLISHTLLNRSMDKPACLRLGVDRHHHGHMAHITTACAAGAEEEQIAGTQIAHTHSIALKVLLTRCTVKRYTEILIYIAGESRAVKSLGPGGAETVTRAEKTLRIVHHLESHEVFRHFHSKRMLHTYKR